MKRERIQKLIDEISDIIRESSEEPIEYDAPKDHGYKQAIAVAKLDAAGDILRAVAKDL